MPKVADLRYNSLIYAIIFYGVCLIPSLNFLFLRSLNSLISIVILCCPIPISLC
jgi:hypothetical protein